MENITFMLAFSAGLMAFISPCCLPLYPTFISYITGITVSELNNKKPKYLRKQILFHSISFSIGFSLIYYILGFSASSIGTIFIEYRDLIRMLGGTFLIAMGIFLAGVFQPKFMMKEHRLQHKKKKVGFINSFIVGLVFSAGWTPCIGPIFGAIIYTNIINPAQTFLNVTAYALGFCIPFIIMAFFISKVRLITKYSDKLTKIGAVIMIVIGFILYFDLMIDINILFSKIKYSIFSMFT
ncbi:cytochrome c biogenesis CcdA family protein [Peribacillus muralis]|uniref:cytochrome c biogenesis CcdA family protein n=1 Tax=Peribacillus muralis TaxID=264697 RepID=UPI003D067852